MKKEKHLRSRVIKGIYYIGRGILNTIISHSVRILVGGEGRQCFLIIGRILSMEIGGNLCMWIGMIVKRKMRFMKGNG